MSERNLFIDQRGHVVELVRWGKFNRCDDCAYGKLRKAFHNQCQKLAPVEHGHADPQVRPCMTGNGIKNYYRGDGLRFAVYKEVKSE